jgi:general secretion pathway protein I
LFRTVRRSTDQSNAGFTLIEVLIALALIASSLAAIGALVATTMRGTTTIEQHVALIETARNIAASIGPHAQVPMGVTSGQTSGYRWRLEALPWMGSGVAMAADSPWSPQLIRIRVQSPSGAVFSLDTVRLRKRPKG